MDGGPVSWQEIGLVWLHSVYILDRKQIGLAHMQRSTEQQQQHCVKVYQEFVVAVATRQGML